MLICKIEHNNSDKEKWNLLAGEVLGQINPFYQKELNLVFSVRQKSKQYAVIFQRLRDNFGPVEVASMQEDYEDIDKEIDDIFV